MALDIVRCPTCGKSVRWAQTPTRPFCSGECKQRDLGTWATGGYRIPGETLEEADGEKPSADKKEDDETKPPRRR